MKVTDAPILTGVTCSFDDNPAAAQFPSHRFLEKAGALAGKSFCHDHYAFLCALVEGDEREEDEDAGIF